MDTFYLYGIVALVAALLKIAILSQVITRSKITSAFNIVCVGMILQHTFEFLGYITFPNNLALGHFFVDGIMLANYFVLAAALYFVVTIVEHKHAKAITTVFSLGALSVAGLHLSGLLINDYINVGYTLIPENGQFYFAFPLLALAAIVSAAVILIQSLNHNDTKIRERSKLTLFALAPLSIIGLGILVAQSFGASISGAVIMPLMSTIFVWAMMMDERGDIVTFKIKWRILSSLAFKMKDVKLKDWLDLVEQQMILEAMRSNDNNQSAAARLLGSNKTTFHRKVQRIYENPPIEVSSGVQYEAKLSPEMAKDNSLTAKTI